MAAGLSLNAQTQADVDIRNVSNAEATFVLSTRIFENDLNLDMLVFIG